MGENKPAHYINGVMRSSDNQDHCIVDVENKSYHAHPILLVVVEFHRHSEQQANVATVEEVSHAVWYKERGNSWILP